MPRTRRRRLKKKQRSLRLRQRLQQEQLHQRRVNERVRQVVARLRGGTEVWMPYPFPDGSYVMYDQMPDAQ